MVSQTSVHTFATSGSADGWEARQQFLDARDKRGDASAQPLHFELPTIPALRNVPRRIDEDDERELRNYYNGPLLAGVLASSGAFGMQLEIASAYGYGSIPCRRCGGRWRTRKRKGNETVAEWRDGTGLCPRDDFGKRVTYASALAAWRLRMQKRLGIVLSSKPRPRPESGMNADDLWRGSVEAFAAQGKTLMTDADFRAMFDRLPEELCRPCQPCQGIGVLPRRSGAHVEVTAYPTGSSKHGSTARRKDVRTAVEDMSESGMLSDGFGAVSMAALAAYQATERILADVCAMSPIAALSLDEYYSVRDNGQRALEQFVGEVFGLEGAARVRAASALRDHQCGCYQLAAYGAVMALALLGGGGLGLGGSGRPDFEPSFHPNNQPLAPDLPPSPKKRHQTPFTPKQKQTRAKRKAQRKARRK